MLRTDSFDFNLPESLIAQDPVFPRDHCKMLSYDSKTGNLCDRLFFEITDFLNDNDVLVLNSSKVIPARILFRSETGKDFEIFVLEELSQNLFRVLVRPGKFFKKGVRFNINQEISAKVEQICDDGSRIISIETIGDFLSQLDEIGKVPLPPYIKNSSSNFDDYQTVYAEQKGSVAAPTAGLHFTRELLDVLENNGVKIFNLVLHVGQGTFSTVNTEFITDHKMHFEKYIIDKKTAEGLNEAKAQNKRIIAVGTTSVRVLESNFDKYKSFKEDNDLTDIFIYPGKYQWQVVDALITNFHLPKSTLLMLVASFLENKGISRPVEKLHEIYGHAISSKYRFFSFGDAMFIY